jgi:MarR family transcriptional regulator, 2-MHQ and catechol-resistance regulon repressor
MTGFGEEANQAAAAWINLCRAQISVSARVLRRLPERITLAQFAVIEALDYLGPMCQRDISQKILKSSGNVTVVVDNLERAGLVWRERSVEDRRFVMVTVTPKGRDLLEAVLPAYMEALRQEFRALSSAERHELARLCRLLGRGNEASEGAHGPEGVLAARDE